MQGEIDASAPFGLGVFFHHNNRIFSMKLTPPQRLAFRSLWFSAKERAYDLWSMTLPIFLVMGVLVLSARFWCWLVGW